MKDSIIDIPFMVLFVILVIILANLFKKEEIIECYKDYMEKNIIATRCEKHFKDLKLGSDSNE